jgi:hypothetical protein
VSHRDLTPETDDDGPSLVRPYALVGGRTSTPATAALPMEAIVVTEAGVDLGALVLERRAIAQLCRRPHSIAEVAALLGLPVGVTRVLVGDLDDDGAVHVNLPLDPQVDGTVDRVLLERVLAGLEAL